MQHNDLRSSFQDTFWTVPKFEDMQHILELLDSITKVNLRSSFHDTCWTICMCLSKGRLVQMTCLGVSRRGQRAKVVLVHLTTLLCGFRQSKRLYFVLFSIRRVEHLLHLSHRNVLTPLHSRCQGFVVQKCFRILSQRLAPQFTFLSPFLRLSRSEVLSDILTKARSSI